jgi:hypothetical protein
MLSALSGEKCCVVCRKEVIECLLCGGVMGFVGVTRPGYDEDNDFTW